MKNMMKFLFKTHKYVGGFIAIFFLMWFVTGLILVKPHHILHRLD